MPSAAGRTGRCPDVADDRCLGAGGQCADVLVALSAEGGKRDQGHSPRTGPFVCAGGDARRKAWRGESGGARTPSNFRSAVVARHSLGWHGSPADGSQTAPTPCTRGRPHPRPSSSHLHAEAGTWLQRLHFRKASSSVTARSEERRV